MVALDSYLGRGCSASGNVPSEIDRREPLFVALLFGIVALAYVLILFRFPLMYGIDGPYYLIQVKAILETGTMNYVDPPLCFYLFAALTLLLGDPTSAIKIGTVLFCALTVLPSYLIGKRLTSSVQAAIASAVVCSLSPGLIALSGEFVKNAVGSFFLLSFIYLCLRILKGDESMVVRLAAVTTLALTALTHILDLGLALLFLILMSMGSFALRANVRKFLSFSAPLIASSILLGAAAYLVSSGYMVDLEKGLAFLQDFFASLEDYDELNPMVELGQGLPAYLSIVGGLVASALLWRRRKVLEVVFVGSSTLVLALLNFPTIPSQWAWRFALMSFVPMCSVVAAIIGLIDSNDVQWGVTILFIPLCLLALTLPAAARQRPVISLDEYRDLTEISKYVPSHSRVVTKVGGRYWVEYLLESQLFRPVPGEPPDAPVYFISDGGSPSPPAGAMLLYRGDALSLYVTLPRRPRP